MPKYFHINYNLDAESVNQQIEERIQQPGADYICVADGNILQMVHHNLEYRRVVNEAMFAICDSNWVPVFIQWIHKFPVQQYCGSQIFDHFLRKKQHRMYFLGTHQTLLEALKTNLVEKYDARIADMEFVELPFCKVEDFDYSAIAEAINKDNPDIIWVALGAPKQEIFMNKLKPYLNRGVMIAVGAAFKFYSGVAEKRAPQWMVRNRMEFLYRLFAEPRKQFCRCWKIVTSLPAILLEERTRVHRLEVRG